jgi:O-methyltransferase involved in polyketide biosynthesis
MATTTPTTLGSVQRTLLLPMWGRAVETRKPHLLLIDPTAARIIETIDYDFSMIAGEYQLHQPIWQALIPKIRSAGENAKDEMQI